MNIYQFIRLIIAIEAKVNFMARTRNRRSFFASQRKHVHQSTCMLVSMEAEVGVTDSIAPMAYKHDIG